MKVILDRDLSEVLEALKNALESELERADQTQSRPALIDELKTAINILENNLQKY